MLCCYTTLWSFVSFLFVHQLHSNLHRIDSWKRGKQHLIAVCVCVLCAQCICIIREECDEWPARMPCCACVCYRRLWAQRVKMPLKINTLKWVREKQITERVTVTSTCEWARANAITLAKQLTTPTRLPFIVLYCDCSVLVSRAYLRYTYSSSAVPYIVGGERRNAMRMKNGGNVCERVSERMSAH